MKNPYLDQLNEEEKRSDRLRMIIGLALFFLCYGGVIWFGIREMKDTEQAKLKPYNHENQR